MQRIVWASLFLLLALAPGCKEKATPPRFEYGTGTAEMDSTKYRMRGDFPSQRVEFSSSKYHFEGTVGGAP